MADENYIVVAEHNSKGYYMTVPRFMYDKGQILRFEGFNLPQAFEVHFQIPGNSSSAYVKVGTTADGVSQVELDDELFTVYANVRCWLYLSDTANDAETRFVIDIPVKNRAKPVDYTPTPSEESAITEAIAALNDAVEHTAADVQSVAEMKQETESAEEDAKEAYYKADKARAEAQVAGTHSAAIYQVSETETESISASMVSILDANGSRYSFVDNAQGHGDHAKHEAQIAANKAFAASVSASQADQSKTSADQSAQEAEQSALSASESAQAAVQSANTAFVASQTATTKASEATQSASAASQSATSAGQSATAATSAKTAAESARDDAISAKTAAQASATLAGQSATAAGNSATAAAGSASDAAQSAQDAEETVADVEEQLGNVLSAIEDIHQIPEGGTSGQILTKKSGTDYDVEWSPVGMPSDEQVDSAVNDWLDDHPEATTTVEDGAITMPKLNDSVKDYMLITAETATEENYNNQENITKLTVSGNNNAFGNVFLCDRQNILPSYPLYTRTHSTQPITAVYDGRFISISGYSAISILLRPYIDYVPKDFEAGDYKLIVKQSPNYSVEKDAVSLVVVIKGTSGQKVLRNLYFGTTSTDVQVDVTVSDGYTSSIGYYVTVPQGFNGTTKLWVGLFKKPCSIIDTEETVEDGETIDVSIDPANYPNGVDTMQHKAIAEYHPPIQEYIDNHIPDDMVTMSDLVYISPEMYGAKGDGTSDDTSAVQLCINDAISGSKIVRGYGVYKTTATITVSGSDLDIFLNKINYIGSGDAIDISGKRIKFGFDQIRAATQTGACCICLKDPATDTTERITIDGVSLYAYGYAIKAQTSSNLLYIVCRIKTISSELSDAVRTTGSVGEFAIYDAYFRCQNGWCFNGNNVKLFNCTMESNCYGGVYATQATISHCRARELMDCLMPGNSLYSQRSGILFKAKSITGLAGTIIDIDDIIYYDTIDLSEVTLFSGDTPYSSVYNGNAGRVTCRVVYGDQNYRYGGYIIGAGMLLHGNDKICIPPFRSVLTVTNSDFDLRDSNFVTYKAARPPFVTDFIIAVDNCVMHLSPSYCAEGFGDITVDMTQYLATIYDRRGNVIFDPTNKDLGKYRLTAIVDHTVDSAYQYKNDALGYPINSGYCDVWEIKKLS